MRTPDTLSIGDVVARLHEFDTVVDARSPSEFRDDHLPRAINAPVLDDTQRVTVGTLYKEQSGFEAKRVGAALVARNIAGHLETVFADRPRHWSPLVYCWRGGNRSSALATVLSRVGWRPVLLEGGYKAFRHQVIGDLERLPPGLRFHVIAGRTGCGKSLLLGELARQGAQVLDLEALAKHRGSVLGRLPGTTQPPQRRFESLLWEALRAFDSARPVFVESESRRIGTCHLPEALMNAIRSGNCLKVEARIDTRVELLMREYGHFIEEPESLEQHLGFLIPLHGHATISKWRSMLGARDWPALVSELLVTHYDPAYERSMARNYSGFAVAQRVELADSTPKSLELAALELLRVGGGKA